MRFFIACSESFMREFLSRRAKTRNKKARPPFEDRARLGVEAQAGEVTAR
jgi:hypothetical protein